MVYLIVFILAGFGVCLNDRMQPWARKAFISIILLYIILILGLRYRVGVDTIAYMNGFKEIKTLDKFFSHDNMEMRYEIGFLFMGSLCKTICKEFFLFQMVMAAITNTCIFIFLYRYCRNVFWGILIFACIQWLYFSTEIMRESAAVGIFLLNYRNMEKRKWGWYYLISLLSISFHYSALITWFFPFVKYLKTNLIFVFLCVGILFVTPIIERINDVLSIESISGRVTNYLELESLNLNWKIGELIRSALPAIITILAYRYSKMQNKFEGFLLLQILLSFGAFAIPLLFARFTNYTTLFVTVSLANLMYSHMTKRWIKVSAISLVLLSQSYYYSKNISIWFPYVSIFDPKQIREREQIWKDNFIFLR